MFQNSKVTNDIVLFRRRLRLLLDTAGLDIQSLGARPIDRRLIERQATIADSSAEGGREGSFAASDFEDGIPDFNLSLGKSIFWLIVLVVPRQFLQTFVEMGITDDLRAKPA